MGGEPWRVSHGQRNTGEDGAWNHVVFSKLYLRTYRFVLRNLKSRIADSSVEELPLGTADGTQGGLYRIADDGYVVGLHATFEDVGATTTTTRFAASVVLNGDKSLPVLSAEGEAPLSVDRQVFSVPCKRNDTIGAWIVFSPGLAPGGDLVMEVTVLVGDATR